MHESSKDASLHGARSVATLEDARQSVPLAGKNILHDDPPREVLEAPPASPHPPAPSPPGVIIDAAAEALHALTTMPHTSSSATSPSRLEANISSITHAPHTAAAAGATGAASGAATGSKGGGVDKGINAVPVVTGLALPPAATLRGLSPMGDDEAIAAVRPAALAAAKKASSMTRSNQRTTTATVKTTTIRSAALSPAPLTSVKVR